MDDAIAVRVLQRGTQLQEKPLHDGNRQCPVALDHRVEWRAIDVLHDEEERIAGIANGVDHHDVRVIESRGRPRLALEPLLHAVVEREVRQHGLDGHLAIQAQVVGEVHDGHAAASDLAADLVLAGGERSDLGEKLGGALGGAGGERTAERRRLRGAARSAEPVFSVDR
jgi:hypothetical protein